MNKNNTADLFDLIDLINNDDYGYSDPVIIYNKNLNRKHMPDDFYFLHGNVVFHHISSTSLDV